MKSILKNLIYPYGITLSLLFGISFNACTQKMSESVNNDKAALNGSFEVVKNNLPVNWLVYTPETVKKGNFDLVIDSDAIDGKQSLKFIIRSCSEKGGWLSPGISQEIKVEPNKTYHIKCWIKNNNSKFRIKVDAIDAFTKDVGPTIESSETTNKWTLHELTYTIPEKMDKLRLEINALQPGTLWIDHITIEKDQ
ncbi:hypothetical protein FRY74_02820 [Vicingus serpentipes]|uniref:CBM-cenC domain-containing protein n=1 Tax=Vicingus serpentipes TaxID=1926625 RepID=A0A5C6RX41_9FLAO|nr:carbohydrate binding domain-containing protein [Vicingus serpentipes]TXB67136.1 hypothetical protein FRY74_02820 [Vicingus serpentipes]